MKKFWLILFIVFAFCGQSYGFDKGSFPKFSFFQDDTKSVRNLLNNQIKYANNANFDKFISTYTDDYKNADGYDLEIYSKLVKDLWNNYNNIKYGIKIKNITFDNENTAIVELSEFSHADIPVTKKMSGILNSKADSVYYLKKVDGKWKVSYDKVVDEVTSMLYGDAANLDIKLTAPKEVTPGYEYCASLEFIPPKDSFAIASISKDEVEYPQKPTKEVFRKLPDDNILERLFIANSDNKNEYVIASIGLTKADIKDLSIKLSLTGFGYQIIRVNVKDIPSVNENTKEKAGLTDNVPNK